MLCGIVLFSLFATSCSLNYYSVSGYGKLTFLNTKDFYFDFFDIGNDTGTYKVVGDTVFLTSSHQPVEYYSNEIKPMLDTLILFDLEMRIYASNEFLFKDNKFIPQYGNLLKDTIVKMDTLNRIHFDEFFLNSGQLICFYFLGEYKYIVPQDTVIKGFLKLNIDLGKRAYFKNYPLLMQDGYLLPFNEEANEFFRRINGFDFLPMKKSKKNKKYNTYLSGFG